MAKKQTEFRPDPKGPGLLSRMYLTRNQRMRLLKWFLYSLLTVILMVVQDVVFSRMSIFGATTDLVPAVLLMICVLEGAESGGIFVLCAGLVYLLSGSAPVRGVLVVLTVLGTGIAIFRQGFLRKGFSTTLLCTGAALLLYELAVFLLGLSSGLTLISRLGVFVLTGVLTLLITPVLYPLLTLIGKIGGDTWKE